MLSADSEMTRRNDPDYLQISGYVPKEIGKQFKMKCLDMEITQTEALEQALQLWVKSLEKPKRQGGDR